MQNVAVINSADFSESCDFVVMYRDNFRAVFQLLDNYCFIYDPVTDYSIEVLSLISLCM